MKVLLFIRLFYFLPTPFHTKFQYKCFFIFNTKNQIKRGGTDFIIQWEQCLFLALGNESDNALMKTESLPPVRLFAMSRKTSQ